MALRDPHIEEVFHLMDRCHAINQSEAERLMDIYSEVFKGLWRNQVKDPVMVGWLVDDLNQAIGEK